MKIRLISLNLSIQELQKCPRSLVSCQCIVLDLVSLHRRQNVSRVEIRGDWVRASEPPLQGCTAFTECLFSWSLSAFVRCLGNWVRDSGNVTFGVNAILLTSLTGKHIPSVRFGAHCVPIRNSMYCVSESDHAQDVQIWTRHMQEVMVKQLL